MEVGNCELCRRRPSSGRGTPLGGSIVSSCERCGSLCVNFAVYTKNAKTLFVCVFPPAAERSECVIRNLARAPVELTGSTGNVRHVAIHGLHQDCSYALWFKGSPRLLLDIHAKYVEARSVCFWGLYEGERHQLAAEGTAGASRVESYIRSFQTLASLGIAFPFRLGRVVAPQSSRCFDWAQDAPPQLAVADVVVYEAHARGLTMALTADDAMPYRRGTLSAIVKRLDYLEWLGVTALELLPVAEFNELEFSSTDELSQLRRGKSSSSGRRVNVWGYMPLQPAAFGPMSRYADTTTSSSFELKLLVRELHRRGMECYLDVVYNHVGGGSCSLHFMNCNKDYFLLDGRGAHSNVSGCGNTLSPNAPNMAQLVMDSLRWWVAEYHIDGFRLDAAGVLARDPSGTPVNSPPVLDAIASDPLLGSGKVKIFVEPWDAGDAIASPNFLIGAYPLDTALEWNPDYQRTVRRFIFHGDEKEGVRHAREFCKAFQGSPHLYASRPYGAQTSVNYLSCHDGFSLADSAAYNWRTNTDGPADDGTTYNHGCEGPSQDRAVNALRARQLRNMTLALALSRGTVLMWQGCETGATKGGNSNPYTEDGPPNWLCCAPERAPLAQFTRAALKLRRRAGTGVDFHDGLVWRGTDGAPCSGWVSAHAAAHESAGVSTGAAAASRLPKGFVACTLRSGLYVAFNAARETRRFALPSGAPWKLVCYTGAHDGAYFRMEDAMSDETAVKRDERYDEHVYHGELVDICERSAVVYERVHSSHDPKAA